MMVTFRSIYSSFGFKKGYNFLLFIIFDGACLGFVLARLPFLSLDGVFCKYRAVINVLQLSAAPGECYTYDVSRGAQRYGIIVHLASILPAMFLACFQFLPILRYKLLILHRVDGYLVIVLFLIANASALVLARHTFEGTIETQAIVGLMVVATTISIALAYYNIKRLQIEQHRAWMLRTFFYAGSIITCRIILIISAIYTSFTGSYYFILPCFKIAFLYKMAEHPTVDLYPACENYFNGTDLNARAIVQAIFTNATRPEHIAAVFDMTFGMALWLGFFIHVIGIEIYLQLTPAESHRLRQISYEKQRAAGLRHPGFSGTTVEKFGDAEYWEPDVVKDDLEK